MGYLLALLLLLFPAIANATTLQVGPTRTYHTPCAAVAVMSDGDTVEIDAGTYTNDSCQWAKNGITIKSALTGAANRPKIQWTQTAGLFQDKAIWLLSGTGTILVDNIELTGANGQSSNAAAIKHELGTPGPVATITFQNMYIHDNEMGILYGSGGTTNYPNVTLTIQKSTFYYNGATANPGQTHNIYINRVGSFTFQYNISANSNQGQLVKSRAAINKILYNRLVDNPTGITNQEIDFSDGGENYVEGNMIYESATTQNHGGMIRQGPENAIATEKLYVVNNTFVSDYPATTFIKTFVAQSEEVIQNNLFVYTGSALILDHSGVAQSDPSNNLKTTTPGFTDQANLNYHLGGSSIAVENPNAINPGTYNGNDLTPSLQYLTSLTSEVRTKAGTYWDMGALESNASFTAGITAPILAGTVNTSGYPVLSWSPSTSDFVITGYPIYRNGSLLATASSTTFTYTDTTASSATAYDYTVKGTNNNGETSAASNTITLASPRLCANGIPSSASGWCQMSSRKLSSVAVSTPAGIGNIFYVVAQAGGALTDTTGKRLLIPVSGGATDYKANPIYALSLTSPLTWSVLQASSSPLAQDVESLSNPTAPNARYTYDGIDFDSTTNEILLYGGRGMGFGALTQSQAVWSYDLPTKIWTLRTTSGTKPTSSFSKTAYDSVTDKLYIDDGGCLRTYNRNTDAFAQAGAGCQTTGLGSMIIDPVSRRLYDIGGGYAVYYKLDGSDSFIQHTISQSGASAVVTANRPGLAWHTALGILTAWAGGDTLYTFNGTAWSSTTYLGGPGAQQANGTFGRFTYAADIDRLVLVNDSSQDVFTLNITPPTPVGAPLSTTQGKVRITGKTRLQ